MPTMQLPKSCTEPITGVPRIVTFEAVEKRMDFNGEQRKTLAKP